MRLSEPEPANSRGEPEFPSRGENSTFGEFKTLMICLIVVRSSADEAANVYADRSNSKKSVARPGRRKPPDPWNNLKMERF